MEKSVIGQSVQTETFKILNNRRTPNWALAMLVLAFTYFNWQPYSNNIILFWVLPNMSIILMREFYLYPLFDRAEIRPDNVEFYLNIYTLNVAITGLVWAISLPFFFSPDSSIMALVFLFVYFILLVSGSIALAAHTPAFICFWLPLFCSLFVTFFSFQESSYIGFALAFLMFNIFILYLARTSRAEIRTLIRLKLEKELLADSLEEKKRIAEKSVEDKNRFLAAASHDLRQPLHTVNLLLSALNNHVEDEKGRNLLDGASNSMQALSNSFKSLLDVSKLDAGVVEINLENLPLHKLVESLLLEFRSTAEDKEIKLTLHMPECIVLCDLNLLSRILRNLISNAVKFTKHGEVIVSAELKENKQILVKVIDTGPGIPQYELTNIFSEYYQLDNPERDRNKGFGLGLAISKRLSDLMNIPLNVFSKEGEGSTFSILLEQGSTTQSKISINAANSSKFAGANILVIDDDISILYGMEQLLFDWDCQALCADSESSAMELLNKSAINIDLIIADYRLRNNKTGVDACINLSEEFNLSAPSIIITGDTSPERLKEVQNSGFRILHKPVKAEKLKSVIAESLA